MSVSVDDNRLKEVLKAAIVEVLEERRDYVRDLIEEVIEGIALSHAIQEGEGSELVSRDEVFKTLERSASKEYG